MSLRFRWITTLWPKRATSQPCATRRTIHHYFQQFTSTPDNFLVPSNCRQLGNSAAGKLPVGTSRLGFSTQTKTASGKGKGANLGGKFDDDGFFDKFLKDDEQGDGGYDSDDEKFLESTQKDFKKDNKPQFVADEFEKLTQPEITKIYEDRLKDIAHVIDPDLPGPDPAKMDVLDLIDKVKDEFSSASSQDVNLRDIATGIDDELSGFSPSMLRIRKKKDDDAATMMRSPFNLARPQHEIDLMDVTAKHLAQQRVFEFRDQSDAQKEAELMDDIFEGVSTETRQPLEALLRKVYGDRVLQFAGPMRTPVVDHGLPEGHWGIDFIDNCRREMMNNPYYPPEEVERALKVYARRIRDIPSQADLDALAAQEEVEEEEEDEFLEDDEDEVWDAWDEEDEDEDY